MHGASGEIGKAGEDHEHTKDALVVAGGQGSRLLTWGDVAEQRCPDVNRP